GLGVGAMDGRGRGMDVRTDARMDSQGPLNANARARARANENSVLRSATEEAEGDVVTEERRNGTFHRRVNSQGAHHADARAIERSNARSALHPALPTTAPGPTTPR